MSLATYQIKSFIILVVIRRSMQRIGGAYFRVIMPAATQHLLKNRQSGGEPLATLFDLTGPRFEPQTSLSRDERVTARPTSRFNFDNYE